MLLLLLFACSDKAPDTSTPGETAPPADSQPPGETDAPGDTEPPDGETDSPVDTEPPPSSGLEDLEPNTRCLARARPVTDAEITVDRVFPKLSFRSPVQLAQAPGDASAWYLAEQGGLLHRFDNDPAVSGTTLLLNLTADLYTSSEAGLLGLAFHPDFATNGQLYVSYTPRSGPGGFASRISRFTSTDGGASFPPESEEVLFEVSQPYSNHNGGHITFGPDGYLYIGLGDGGSAGDPLGSGQDTATVLGGILRIDVDGKLPYAIPPDNPFAAGGGAPELYAWGLRNPWRFTFDRATGDLWAGDVGQDAWEEVDFIELGGNYGWNEREGAHCYPADPCETAGLIDPVVEYPHTSRSQSVVGGFVYRGSAVPDLEGVLVYSEFYDGTIYGLFYDERTGEPDPRELIESGIFPSSFAEDADGELYMLDYDGGGVYRIGPAGEPKEDTFPALLSETGCVDMADPLSPPGWVIPYGVNVPFWSDGAEKTRWVALPEGAAITADGEGDLEFPVGTVIVKHFELGGALVETRLLMRHDDGDWAGYSYRWEGKDAALLSGSALATSEASSWYYPARSECLQCHTEAGGRTLGLEVAQLNGDFTYPNGATQNQLAAWIEAGVLDPKLDVEAAPALPDLEGEAPLEDRARAYLHANCAQCHTAGGTGGGEANMRFDVSLADSLLCDGVPAHGDLGVADARLVAPGEPERSLVPLRMKEEGAYRMPGLGSIVVDEAGVSLIEAWIGDLSSCP
jgi:uncharacterized repeat protein (TIGR03806 family)